jgi:hypothetical protein
VLYRFPYLVGFEAGGAHFHPLRPVAKNGPDLVKVGIETAFGGVHRMAAVIADLGAFSANIAYS